MCTILARKSLFFQPICLCSLCAIKNRILHVPTARLGTFPSVLLDPFLSQLFLAWSCLLGYGSSSSSRRKKRGYWASYGYLPGSRCTFIIALKKRSLLHGR